MFGRLSKFKKTLKADKREISEQVDRRTGQEDNTVDRTLGKECTGRESRKTVEDDSSRGRDKMTIQEYRKGRQGKRTGAPARMTAQNGRKVEQDRRPVQND